MHALRILHRCIGPLLLGTIHRSRLALLFDAVAATVGGPRLTLTEIGRRFGGGSDLRHRIKRADRLLGNRHLQRDSRSIYGALGRMLLAGVPASSGARATAIPAPLSCGLNRLADIAETFAIFHPSIPAGP